MARAVDAYVHNEVRTIEAHKTRVRAKDHLEGVIAPPKGVTGLYKLHDDERRQRFVPAMVKEISALTDMGTLSHMHSKAELWEKFKVDLDVTPPVPTLMVFENKIHDGNTNAEDMTAKARMCVEGTKRHMKQGVHYDSVYAATPGQDSILFFNALVLHLKLARRAFDVGNAYAWAAQDQKLALQSPRGLEQYHSETGEQLWMCLQKNT